MLAVAGTAAPAFQYKARTAAAYISGQLNREDGAPRSSHPPMPTDDSEAGQPALPESKYRWTVKDVEDEARVVKMAHSLNDLPMPLARSLVLRGVSTFEEARSFFRADLKHLHDPFQMQDMEAAADRLAAAIRNGERVMIYGDYDVDGTTSTAMLVTFLRGLGVETSFFIPNRFEHGYGVSQAGLDEAVQRGVSLVITIDCGITAIEEARYAKAQGLDVLICDHHMPEAELPEAVAVLDPKREDCTYPFDGLSGCGVGFKLIQATLHVLGRDPAEAWPLLDLVAVSTASDIVPMVDENRILMRHGLEQLCVEPRLGLSLLAARAKVDLSVCTASKIVFQIGPRINAAGRLDDASIAAQLLAEGDPVSAHRLVDEIETLNQRRRELDRKTRDEALAMAERFMQDDPVALVLHHPDWHPGVIGITASRVAETFHRPAVLLTSNGSGQAHGSARSVKGINVHRALSRCADLLDRFGGHAFAAGVALCEGKVEALRERMQVAVGEAVETTDDLVPELEIDAHLDLGDVTSRFWNVLQQFSPHGPDNMRPLFLGRDLRVVGQPSTVGAEGRHLKFRVAQRNGEGRTFPVIGFGLGDRHAVAMASIRRGRPLDLAFNLDENTWRGRTSLQLRMKDLRLQGSA